MCGYRVDASVTVCWLQLANIQANYHRQSLKLLDQMLPALTEEIGNHAIH